MAKHKVKYYPKGIEDYFHPKYLCDRRPCVIHAPSDHHMDTWDVNIRVDREYGLAERLCPHGIGHPDPDSLAFIAREVGGTPDKPYGPYASDIHGCDGCCSTPS